jgi:thiosulfate/3-mercaptopyruvate sulfurtransferase
MAGSQLKSSYKGLDPRFVTSVNEASKLAGKNDVLFVDTRNYWKYAKGHIPGAENLELYAFHWTDTSKKGLDVFAKQMARLFSSIGVTPKTGVIFYQNNSGYDTARGVWLLNWLGHTRTSMLDGGLNLWKRTGHKLSTEDPRPRPASKFEVKFNPDVIATLDMTRSAVTAKLGNTKILDARSEKEYKGTARRAQKSGHIRSSLNVEWKRSLRRDGTLKSAKQLKTLFEPLTRESPIITYCQSGYRAAHSWLVLSALGFKNVKNYLGSWYEWGNEKDAAAE